MVTIICVVKGGYVVSQKKEALLPLKEFSSSGVSLT